MGSFIILVAGIIFDFHKSWSVGFARLLCSAGTMAIPQPPALPSIAQFPQIMTLPLICVCVWAPLNDSLGKSHLNHNRWVMTDRNRPWVMPTENVSSILSLFFALCLFFYIFRFSSAFMQKHATGTYWRKSLLWPISLTNTLNVDTSVFIELHFFYRATFLSYISDPLWDHLGLRAKNRFNEPVL